MKHTIREELFSLLAFIGMIWGVFLVGLVVPFHLNSYGVTPRTLVGLAGIPAMPFLHENLGHLVRNTMPLSVLLLLLAGSRARTWKIVVDIVLLSGILLWLFGRPATHIGASGLIFGLIAFLIASGFFEKRIPAIAIAVVVGFLYGGTLITGVLPRTGSNVSWDGHLCGAIAGGIIAYMLTQRTPRRTN
jgi:membrane associated rhomboid family serine protease